MSEYAGLLATRHAALWPPVKRKSEYLQFRPYRAIVAAPIKPLKMAEGASALRRWIYAGVVVLGGSLAFVGWRFLKQ